MKFNNLDDMARHFFKVARESGHPIKKLDIKLTKSWGEQSQELKQK